MLSFLLLAASLAARGAALPAESSAHDTPKVIVSWSGGDSEREDAHFFPLVDAASFDAMWLDAVIRPGSSRWPSLLLKPRVDFTTCAGFALTAGTTWNSHGFLVDSITNVSGAWHVRVRQDTYAGESADRVRPYGIFLLTRVEGATIIVEEDVRDRIDEPPRWQERGRFGVPKLAALEPVAPAETAAFAPRVLAAVRDYTAFRRVSDQPHWSPLLCSAPPRAGAFVSASGDATTHGGKLYYLYARDDAAYCPPPELETGLDRAPGPPLVPAPIGQTLVKESWTAKLVDAPVEERGNLPSDQAARDGRVYARGEARELFVMLKLDPATPDTDAGWIYATVTPDRKTVTAAGRIASCMACHTEAGHDRQFGVPDDWYTMRCAPRGK